MGNDETNGNGHDEQPTGQDNHIEGSLAALSPAERGLHYVTNADRKGWLKVRWSDGITFPPLPQYLAVQLTGTKDGRDFFIRKEGLMTKKEGSVKRKEDGGSYLTQTPPPHGAAASVVFFRKSAKLQYLDVTLNAITLADNPVAVGTHELEIPYEYHPDGTQYEDQSPFAATWFRIGHDGDRFLHPGRRSAGCVTVTDVREWSALYNYLIKARLDSLSVGTIKVVDT